MSFLAIWVQIWVKGEGVLIDLIHRGGAAGATTGHTAVAFNMVPHKVDTAHSNENFYNAILIQEL